MSIKTESTTDSPEEMTRAFEAIGQPVEISTFEDGLHETPTPDETPAPAQTGAPATPPAPAAPEPAEPEDEDLESAILDDTLPKGVRTRIQKLLAKATRQKYEAEAALKAAKPAEPPPAAPAEPAEPAAQPPVADPAAKPKPKLEDFLESDDPQTAYIEALTDWKTENAKAELRAELQRSTETANADAEAQEWHGAVFEAGKTAHPDWEAKANDPATKEVLLSLPLFLALEETGDPALTADLVYHLTTHPEEAKRIYDLTNHKPDASPVEIVRANRIVGMEVARMTALLRPSGAPAPASAPAAAAAPAPALPRVTGAPPPIRPVHGAAPSTAPSPYDTSRQMPYREYIAWKKSQGLKV